MALRRTTRPRTTPLATQQQGGAAYDMQQNQQANQANSGTPYVSAVNGDYRDNSLPKDPAFVNTWDTPQNAPQSPERRPRPLSELSDTPPPPGEDWLGPDPQYSLPEQSVQMAQFQSPQQAPQPPTLGSKTYQTFAEYSKPFKDALAPDDSYFDGSPYQDAFSSQVSAANQYKTNSLADAEKARQYALEDANKLYTDESTQLEKSYDPKLSSTKQFLSDRGILDSSAAGQKLIDLLTSQQDSVKRVQDDQAKRVQTINETYNSRSAQIDQQVQQQIADQQNLLAQRLDALAKDRRVAEENKQQFKYQIYKDYQNELQQIDAQTRQAKLDEYNMAQDALKNDLDVASVTGMYQGQPTFKSQQEAADAAYKQEQDALKNELAQQKFDLSLMKKTGSSGGGSSGSSNKGVVDVSSGIDKIALLRANGFTPLDAKNLVAAEYDAAGKRALNAAFLNEALSPDPQGPVQPGASNAVGNFLTSLFKISPTQLKTPQAPNPLTPKKATSGSLDEIIQQALLKRAAK